MTKICTLCKVEKPLGLFAKASHHKHGRGSWCSACKNRVAKERHRLDPTRGRQLKTAWRKKNPGYFLRKYWPGSSSKEAWDNYTALLATQQDRCAICRRHKDQFKTPLEVDHCHTTQIVRGLLCTGCNPALGSFQDSPEVCIAAAAYLRQNSAPRQP